MGFMIQGPSNFPYSYTYQDLKAYFNELDKTKSHIPHPPSVPMLLGLPQTTNLFDLLSSLLYGTTVSVGISLGISAVVIVASTTRPLLSFAAILSISFSISTITAALLIFGWTINVIEATILVITIGLCFDYTLHLAVAYKLSSDIVVTEKVREANEACAIPIALASITNISAGLILFFSKTQAFFEIGVFLVVMTL
uniref:Uncharacterized protein n=1 Tax=Panagrolaimus sp. ES5 TaxID=591445 RepID=A0AC34GTD1_9BILA